MERRGIYRKGSAGHARNASSYRISKQKFRKWRFPVTFLLALFFVFATAPIVGEQFQASLITEPDTVALVNTNPDHARKVLLSALHDFVKDCERFKISECAAAGRGLVSAAADPKNDLAGFLPEIEKFENRFSKEVSRRACKFDLGNALLQTKSFQKFLKSFTEKYDEEFDDADFSEGVRNFNSSVYSLDKFVESCFKG